MDSAPVARHRRRGNRKRGHVVAALREPPLPTRATGRPRRALLQHTGLYARHVGATRCVAGRWLRPPPHPLRPRRGGERFARLSERAESCHLFPTKQQRDASPWQGEAGAQRRVRVDPAVHVGATRCVALVRSCTTAPHHPGCPSATAPRATHRVAPTLPAGRVPMNHARFGAGWGHGTAVAPPRTGTGVAHGVVLAVVRL